MAEQMGLTFPLERKLTTLSMLDYFRLAVFRAWFWSCRLLVLDRLTEVLRRRDLDQLMQCVQLLLGQGAAVFLCDMDEEFLYRYVNRVDVVKNRRTCFRLYPEEFDSRLYEILGWERRSSADRTVPPSGPDGPVVLQVTDLAFPSMTPLHFQIRRGEIAFLRDENYNTVSRIRDCFLGEQSWLSGDFCLCGRSYAHAELAKVIGTKIGIQIERPDRPGGVLFGQFDRARQPRHLSAPQGWAAYHPPRAYGKHHGRGIPLVFPRGAAASAQRVAAARAPAFFLFQVVFSQSAAADLFFPVCRTGVRAS